MRIVEVIEKYRVVFNPDGRINACGREACKDLISEIHRSFPEIGQVGNAETGVMDVDKIKEFVAEVRDLILA